MAPAISQRYPLAYSLFYLFLYQGMCALLIGGGSEFGIAWGMYRHSPHMVTLWAFPNTLSGDCALSLFIQVGVTWLTEELIVGYDDYVDETFEFPAYILNYFQEIIVVRKGKLSKFLQWYFEIPTGMLPHKNENDFSNNNDVDIKKLSIIGYLKKSTTKYPNRNFLFNFIEWLMRKIGRALLFGIILFLFMWPITMGIMAAKGTRIYSYDYYYTHFPTPQIMKTIYGAIIGIIATPVSITVIIIRNRLYERSIKENSHIDNVNTHAASVPVEFESLSSNSENMNESKDIEKQQQKTTSNSVTSCFPKSLSDSNS